MSKKVKVRVAVAVAPDGSWYAVGYSGAHEDAELMDAATFDMDSGYNECFLEAELDIPEPVTVQAEVVG